MICDTLDQLHLYKGFHKNLDTAIEFLAAHPLDSLPLGRTEVDGDEVFINVMDADLKPHTGSHAEYHRLYADLQIDLTAARAGATRPPPAPRWSPTSRISAKRTARMPFSALWAKGGSSSSSPGELHRPGVEMPGCNRVRKAVVKIKMEDKYHG